MDESQLRALIAQILTEMLAPKRVLVLFTGARLGADEAIGQLGLLKAAGFTLNGLQTPTATAILDQQRIAALGLGVPAGSLAGTHDLLLVPTLSTNTAAKVACGVADDMASNVIAGFLREGRPIVAAREGACPDCAARLAIHPHTPAAYRARLRANLEALADFGVTLTAARTLAQAAQSCLRGGPAPLPRPPATIPGPAASGRVLGERTVQTWPRGSSQRVPAGTRVTPLAREAARARDITIICEEGF
ncbi:MAG: flavoprotein [Actinomycetia bacterium]|nr:flavoprotein [Actinomycetes bacterium]